MFDQIKNFFIDTLAQKLQANGYQISADTIKNALNNAPHLMQQIQDIMASDSKDRMKKIVALINSAGGDDTQDSGKK